MRVDSDDEMEKEYDMLDSDLDDDELKKHAADTPATTAPSTPPNGPASDPSTNDVPVKKLPRRRSKVLACTFAGCDKVFDRKLRLEDHLRSHNNERNFVCPHEGCTKAFLRDSHLKHHIKNQHTDIRDYVCDWEGCGASFTTGTRLRRHIETHEAKEKFRCRGYSGCDQTFRKQETLDRHILSVHQNVKPFPCKELDSLTGTPCKKSYDTAEHLRSHVRAKHDTTRFSCDECKARNMDILHNSEGQDDREVVQAHFATYGELQAHITIVHPPTCNLCPTSFTTNKELQRHLEVQHGILSSKTIGKEASLLACTYEGCFKKFTKKGNLNVHVKTVHENKHDFVCGKSEITVPKELADKEGVMLWGCNRSFTSKATLEEHVRTAHLELPSKRMVRKRKRKADVADACDEDDFLPTIGGGVKLKKQKQRKPRSDKGVARKSAMSSLTGAASTLVPPATSLAAARMEVGAFQPDFADYLTMPMDEDPGDQYHHDSTFLSSSMTMYDDHIYHRGNSYHYASGDYPTLLSRDLARTTVKDEPADDLFSNADNAGTVNGLGFLGVDDYEDVNFFGTFEQELDSEYPAL